MCHATCLGLLRKSDDWIGACSDSKWFKGDDGSKAESLYNQWADREAAKFEKVCFTYYTCLRVELGCHKNVRYHEHIQETLLEKFNL